MLNNSVNIIGTVCSEFTYSHTVHNEKIFLVYVCSRRTSGYEDIIPVQLSERLRDINSNMNGQRVEIDGSYRNYNFRTDEGKRGTELYVFANLFRPTDIEYDLNSATLEGFLCKNPVYRKTPSGKSIAQVTLAVNRKCNNSDYLPILCWSNNAGYIAALSVGDLVRVTGRIQSRNYKMLMGDQYEDRTAYDVSVFWIDYNTCTA